MGKQSCHIQTRNKLKNIAETSVFNEILDAVMLPPKHKQLMCMFYIQGMNFIEIGNALGVEEITAKTWHRKALNKISEMI